MANGEVFTVGLRMPGGIAGGGQLTISRDVLVAAPGSATSWAGHAHEVRQVDRHVGIWIARLMPPWVNVQIPIRGEGGCLVVGLPIWTRRHVRAALQEAGYEVAEHVTWLDHSMWAPEVWSR